MYADVIVLLMLAIGDICLIVDLRRRRSRYLRMDRMTRSLQMHIRSQISPDSVVAPPRRRLVRIS
jgi:hypothetical protein